jgi:linoleoyl-CoA desaturase
MAKVHFNKNKLFYSSLKKSVDAYFKEQGLKPTGNWRLYSKTLILFPLAIGCYIFLLNGGYTAAVGLAVAALMGLTNASIGFNVMHDACHGSYSSKKWVNNLLGLTLNALGGNAFFWKQKHNVLHHTYTNIEGIDDDIAQSKLLRQSPTQEWMPLHRYQHLYLTVAYSFTMFMWVSVRDFKKYFTRKIYNTPLQPMDRAEHITFWVSKLLYVLFYIALPIIFVGFQAWLVGYLVMNILTGIVVSYVFQLAHAVEGPEFDSVGIEDKLIENEWAVHQVRTTSNFAINNPWINWYVGGLNFQVEHHLFPRISHVHYPAISKIVQEHCKQFDLPYLCFPTIGQAIVSHVRTMKHMGQKPEPMRASVAA